MIITLKEGRLTITPMSIPEPVSSFYVQYEFEPNTAHLRPMLTVGNKSFFGDRMNIMLPEDLKDGDTLIVVELFGNDMFPIRRYTAMVPLVRYAVFGPMPVRPDFFPYIRQLEYEMEQLKIKHAEEVKVLRERITTLEETGEVI